MPRLKLPRHPSHPTTRALGMTLGISAVLTLTACQSMTPQAQPPVGSNVHLSDTYPSLPPAKDIIRLKERQTVKAPSTPISVTFDSVLSDDRCPYNARCIWAGNATVALTVTNSDGKTQRVNLSSGDLRGDLKRKTTLFGHSIALETVYPTPSTTTNMQDLKGQYLIDVKVVAAS